MSKQNESAAQKPAGVSKHIISFAVMILLTAIAFYLVANDVVSLQVVIPVIIACAFVQALLQLFIFMHLDQKGSFFPIFFIVSGIGFAVICTVGILVM